MGQNQTKPVQCGAYQQEQPNEAYGDEAAKRIRKKLEEGKVRPEEPNFPIQNYQPPQQPQSQPQSNPQQQGQPQYQQNPMMPQSPQHQPQLQIQPISQAPQQNRKNIEIQPPKDMIAQENERKGLPIGKPPKPKSAKTNPQPQQNQHPVSPHPQHQPQIINQQIQQHPPQPQFAPQQQPQQQQRVQVQPHPNSPRPELEHQNLIKLSPYPFPNCIQTDKGFLEHCQLSVAQLIESRYNTKMYFPQENVIALFESIIYAMAALEAKQIRHHDIYPTNIFFHNSIFKLSNPNLTPLSSYHLTLNRKRFSFLSPELIICLREQIEPIKQDLLFRADMFSFGLVMLEFCSLKPSQQCYDQQNYDIIDVVIKRRLAEIKQIYNPRISEGIEMLLKYQLEKRMGALQFARHLNQAVHQHQAEVASKKSQVNIQGEQQQQVQTDRGQSNSRVNIISPKNLPTGMQQQQQNVQIMQHQQPPQQQYQQLPPQQPPQQPVQQHFQQPPPQQIIRQIPRQTQRQIPQYQVPHQQQQSRPVHSPPPSQNQNHHFPQSPQPQYPSQQQQQSSSQTNSRVNIISSPVSVPYQQQHILSQSPIPQSNQPQYVPTQQQQQQPPPPSYQYVQSPPMPPSQGPPQIQRTYISSPPPQYIQNEPKQYLNPTSLPTTPSTYNYNSNQPAPLQSGYIIIDPSHNNNKYQQSSYTFQSSNYPSSSSTPFPTAYTKTLGELEYSNIPSYTNTPTNNFMKPERDAQYGLPSSNYKEYNTYRDRDPSPNRVTTTALTSRETDYNYLRNNTPISGKDFYKQKEWTDIKNDLSNKYGFQNKYQNKYENKYDNKYDNKYQNKFQNKFQNKYENKYNYSTSLPSPKHQEESLEERVRRILQKSKQIK